jgi:Dual specificity phosphatase, catalytic domain/Starch binding domain
VDYG